MNKVALLVWTMMLLGRCAFGQSAAMPRIDPKVWELAQTQEFVPVFIVLKNQPQRDIVRRLENEARHTIRGAEERISRGNKIGTFDIEEVRRGNAELEAITLGIRQSAAREITMLTISEQNALEAKLTSLGAVRIRRFTTINMLAAEIPGSALVTLELDPTISSIFAIGETLSQLNLSVPVLGAPAFWNGGNTGLGQSVAIIDSGITNHPAFGGKTINDIVFLDQGSTLPNFCDSALSPLDLVGHGTHIAGIITGQGSPSWLAYQGVAKGIAASG